MTRMNGHGPWDRMWRADPVPLTEEKKAALRMNGMDDEGLARLANAEVWRNALYVVNVERRPDGTVWELSIRRADRRAIRDWRHFQRIKTEIAGADVEAAELYPSEDRLMDTANQYYLFCLPPGERYPFGYDHGRNVRDADEVTVPGAVQRPLPEDWKRS